MKQIQFEQERRFWREMYSESRSIVTEVSEYELKSGHGRDDELTVFQEGSWVLVLTVNPLLEYVGLTGYDLDDEPVSCDTLEDGFVDVLEPFGSVFFQNDWEIAEVFGSARAPFVELDEEAVASKLADYIAC